MERIIARGGFELDFNWKNGKIVRVIIRSKEGGVCRLRSLNRLNGKGLKMAEKENANPLYALNAVKTPIINENVKLEPVRLKMTYLYDLNTQKNGEYVLTGM